jgi:hypothetical protein
MWATLLILIAAAYFALGLLFALAFVTLGGAARLDPAARHATLTFRLFILPGAAALWPLLLSRWLGSPSLAPAPTPTPAPGEPRP